MIATLVYILCTLTSLGCSLLLWRGYRKTRLRLLSWSAACFAILAVCNALLFFDLIVFPQTDLLVFRNLATLVALLVLLYGLVFESH
ncbi:MAG: DUF5985 family protein [Chthoniobacter sp.]|uniref:DUF5985 family protein n=1 Tax=Chthoniobacter sp. TaxID=2510640 RepID=UPI0032A62D8B